MQRITPLALDVLDTRGTMVEPVSERTLITMMDFDNDPAFSMMDMTEELWEGMNLSEPDPEPVLEDDPAVDHTVDDDDAEVTFND